LLERLGRGLLEPVGAHAQQVLAQETLDRFDLCRIELPGRGRVRDPVLSPAAHRLQGVQGTDLFQQLLEQLGIDWRKVRVQRPVRVVWLQRADDPPTFLLRVAEVAGQCPPA
jgi:hypothetical protein